MHCVRGYLVGAELVSWDHEVEIVQCKINYNWCCIIIIIIIIIIILSHSRSTCWMKASLLSHDNLTWALWFHVTDPQKSPILSLHLFEVLPLGRLPSMGLQSVTCHVHLLSWMWTMWPAQVSFLALMTCMMSRTLVLHLIHWFVLWSCQGTPIIDRYIFLWAAGRRRSEALVNLQVSDARSLLASCNTHWLCRFFFKLFGILLFRTILCSLKLFQPAWIGLFISFAMSASSRLTLCPR